MSATVNIIWSLFNLAIGYVLFRAGKVTSEGLPAAIVFFTGIAAISIILSVNFAQKHAN